MELPPLFMTHLQEEEGEGEKEGESECDFSS